MAEKNELSKYFANSTDKSVGIGFRQLTKNEEDLDSEPAVCTLFANADADTNSFFDMIGSNIADSSHELGANIGKESVSTISPLQERQRELQLMFDNLKLSVPEKILKAGRVSDAERSRAAWIPPESTRKILIAMATSPPGSYSQDRESLTMPGVVLEEDLKDAVTEAVNHYLGSTEAAKRKVLTANDVTQDDRGLRSLIEAGCYRAAVNLTKPLLTIYGQGSGRAGHPSKHTVHSIQLWFTRLALLVKLRSFMIADVEAEPFGDMDRPDLFLQYYPELNGGRLGSLVPFRFRLLVAQIPMYIEKHQICLTKLHKILATVRKMIGNLEKGLMEDGTPCDLSPTRREESLKIWRHRETLVLHSIVNCSLSFKDFTLAIEVLQVLLSRETEEKDRAILQSALGRTLLRLGDVLSAEKQFQPLRLSEDPADRVRSLVNTGLLFVADSRFKDALTVFEQAAKIEPVNIMILNSISVCLLYLGRLKEAVIVLENGLQAYPNLALHEKYLLNLCNLYELQSSQCLNSKLNLLSLVSKYRGDNADISCLKL